MTLWTPDLPTIIANMKFLNTSAFWTGYERFNETSFIDKATLTYSNCQSNSWLSELNKDRVRIGLSCSPMIILSNLTEKIMKHQTYDFCHDWEWDGKLIAVLRGYRLFGYQVSSISGLETTDCLCYKYFPSLVDIISNHKKVVEYSLFGLLRKVQGYYNS